LGSLLCWRLFFIASIANDAARVPRNNLEGSNFSGDLAVHADNRMVINSYTVNDTHVGA
jgi:hypothetical protein